MKDEPKPELPEVKLATQDWVLKEIMDTENRIEKAFHQQTIYLGEKLNMQTRWMVGLMITMTIAIIIAVLFK